MQTKYNPYECISIQSCRARVARQLLLEWEQYKTISKDRYLKNTQEHSVGVFVSGNKAEERCRRGSLCKITGCAHWQCGWTSLSAQAQCRADYSLTAAVKLNSATKPLLENRYLAQWFPQLPTQFHLVDLCGALNNKSVFFMPDLLIKFWVSNLSRSSCVSRGLIYVFFQGKKMYCKAGLFARQCLTKQYEM